MIPIYSETKALIFDIDGTLIDTMPVHYKACQIVCKQYGFEFPLDFFYEKAGIPTLKVFDMLVKKLNLDLDGYEIGRQKEAQYLELLSEVKPMDKVYEVAKNHYGKIPMSLGTGGTREVALRTIKAAGIPDMFDYIITADDVKNHKPFPDTFLLCAEKMGIPPANCQVFEDADPGIEAAIAAGMRYTDVRKYTEQKIQK